MTNRIFRTAPRAAARRPRGTRFRYRLSEAATVRIEIRAALRAVAWGAAAGRRLAA